MSKKKNKSNVLVIIAVFLIVLGGLMVYNSYVSGNKGLIASAISSIVIGVALIYMSQKAIKGKRR
ncbi:hypothetical protein OAD50_04085 [Vicingaceae bacterium]|jgi:hypothetical protein|nr:hypothetical protein [Vicingaceae bacterium]MDB4060525.1 hypothetical protein [Vicingaceae bacterium]MDB9964231.1 hypothetical protein [Vicingaceae bacterium]|tara:strand:- start:2311 stop:2505 length:195 start_codon:yes stop_codon:yes gene_type:complete